MSNLLPQASTEVAQSLSSAKPVFFEDSFESSAFSIYELLNLSAMRQHEGLHERQAYRNELLRFLDSDLKAIAPMAFSWEVDGKSYESTSMLFELYMTTLAVGESLLRSQKHYKEAAAMFVHAQEIRKEWKTAELVCPSCPHVCTDDYLQNTLLLSKASHLLKTLRNGKRRNMVLSSAMHFAGQVSFHLTEWSDTALNHYLASRALLFYDISQKDKDDLEQGSSANESFTAAKEALEVCQLIDRSKCHMDEALDQELNAILTSAPEFMQSVQNVFYAVPVPVDTIQLPASLKNDTKQAGEN